MHAHHYLSFLDCWDSNVRGRRRSTFATRSAAGCGSHFGLASDGRGFDRGWWGNPALPSRCRGRRRSTPYAWVTRTWPT